MFYKPEIFSLVGQFMDVLEENDAFASSLRAGTQTMLQQQSQQSAKASNGFGVVNVKIDAPIIILPDGEGLWVADMGVFAIRKGTLDQHTPVENFLVETILECSDTKLHYSRKVNLKMPNQPEISGEVVESQLVPVAEEPQEITFDNLNLLAAHPNFVLDMVESQTHQIVQAVNFKVMIGKQIQSLSTSPAASACSSHTLVELEPFKVELIPGSLDSLFSTVFSLFKDSTREQDRVRKIVKRADHATPSFPDTEARSSPNAEPNPTSPVARETTVIQNTMVHYNVGYDYWEPGVLYLDKTAVHMVSASHKILGSWGYDNITAVSVSSTRQSARGESSSSPYYFLTFLWGPKSVEFRCRNMQTLNTVKFKLQEIKMLKEQELAKVNTNPFGTTEADLYSSSAALETPTQPNSTSSQSIADSEVLSSKIDEQEKDSSFSVSVVSKGITFSVSGYHSRGVDFSVEVAGCNYTLNSSGTQEVGQLSINTLVVRDTKEGRGIVVLAGNTDKVNGLQYQYEFGVGTLVSKLILGKIECAYKVDYIRSLLLLSEVVLDLILQNTESAEIKAYKASKGDGGVQGDRKIPGLPEFVDPGQELVNLKPVSSLHSTLVLEIDSTKVLLFYKKEIQCVEVETGQISFEVQMKGEDMAVKGTIVQAGVYDLHSYPYRKNSAGGKREALLCLKQDGVIKVDVAMTPQSLKTNYLIKGIQVYWIQQRAMRLIDFLMFQVMEIFYPSLLSMSSHYSAEEVTKFALAVLQDNGFAEQHIDLQDIEITLPSTTDPGTYLRITAGRGEASNKRFLLKKTCNQDKLSFFPLIEPETEVWSVGLRNILLEVSSCSNVAVVQDLLWDSDPMASRSYARQVASDPFELTFEVQLLKKTFELQFLYDVITDPLKFPKGIKTNQQQSSKVREAKPKCTATEFTTQLNKYLARLQEGRPKEQLCLDGRYVLEIKSNSAKVILTNQVVNVLLVVLSNNINFDDQMEETLKNAYEISTDGVPVLTKIAFRQVIASIPDLKHFETELISLELKFLKMVCDKQSNFETLIDMLSSECSGEFGAGVPISDKHKRFITQTEYNEVLEGSSEDEGMDDKPPGLVYMTGKMHFYPTGKKEIEIKFSRAQLRLFSFLSRLIPELLTLDQVPLPTGFTEPPAGAFSFLVKIPRAEVCLTSGQESCLVMSSDLNYHMHSDAKSSQQIISLSNTEVFDCLEDVYISKGIEGVKKRNITRPFDFNFIMRENLAQNSLDFTISSGSILAKLTAFNLEVLQSIYTYQSFAEELVKDRSVYFVSTPERAKTLSDQARRTGGRQTDDLVELAQKQRIRTNLSIDGFSFVYVDNYKDIFLPVLRFDLKIKDFRHSVKAETEIETLVEFNALHNNSNIAKWEPLIEPVTISLKYNDREDMGILNVAFGSEETNMEGLYFNLTEELLETVLHCLSNIKKVMEQKHTRELQEQGSKLLSVAGTPRANDSTPSKSPQAGASFALDPFSPSSNLEPWEEIYDSQFLVKNHTGHDIWVQTVGDKKGKKIGLKAGQERFVSFLLNDEFSTKESLNRDMILTFGPDIAQKAPIIFSVEKLGQVYQEINRMPVIITVMKENLKRVAIISSRLKLVNQTNLKLQYAVMSEHSVFTQGEMNPNTGEAPIPFDKIYETLTLGIKTSLSEKISLAKISRTQSKVLYKTPLICARESYNHLCIDVVPRGFCHDLQIKPILKIFNYCPALVEYTLKAKGFSESNMIYRGKSLEIYQFDPYEQESRLTLTCGDIFTENVDLRPFLQKKAGYSETVKLKAKQVPDSKLYLELTNLRDKNTIIIHSKLNIFNETGLHLDIKSFNSSSLSTSQRDLIPAGDRSILFAPGRKHDTFVVYGTAKTLESLPGAGPLARTSYSAFPKKMNCTINQTIRGGREQGYFELNMLVIPKVVRLADGILTKTLTISPKYVFINNTAFSMTLIQQLSKCSF